ncbi:DUF4287 domain-containing protein [Ramlibacter sp. PS4R-6]|uniref:DUF4287 domain-containing protein n=1 Tax=Ramlibacter sp. PS4R-6 TaxID=3133438 RepID=UPI0030B59DB9
MTFEAYINNIRAKTGKGPAEFYEEAVRCGTLTPATKPMEFVAWLKSSSGLGHGHSMAVWEAFKRQGWIPMAAVKAKAPRTATRSRA